MSDARSRAAATAALFSSAPPPSGAPPQSSAAARPARRPATSPGRKVRRTIDLPFARHRALAQWCENTAVEIGASRVSGQDTIEALVHLLLTDETTARKIRRALADDLS